MFGVCMRVCMARLVCKDCALSVDDCVISVFGVVSCVWKRIECRNACGSCLCISMVVRELVVGYFGQW